jgi:hypothetical protein
MSSLLSTNTLSKLTYEIFSENISKHEPDSDEEKYWQNIMGLLIKYNKVSLKCTYNSDFFLYIIFRYLMVTYNIDKYKSIASYFDRSIVTENIFSKFKQFYNRYHDYDFSNDLDKLVDYVFYFVADIKNTKTIVSPYKKINDIIIDEMLTPNITFDQGNIMQIYVYEANAYIDEKAMKTNYTIIYDIKAREILYIYFGQFYSGTFGEYRSPFISYGKYVQLYKLYGDIINKYASTNTVGPRVPNETSIVQYFSKINVDIDITEILYKQIYSLVRLLDDIENHADFKPAFKYLVSKTDDHLDKLLNTFIENIDHDVFTIHDNSFIKSTRIKEYGIKLNNLTVSEKNKLIYSTFTSLATSEMIICSKFQNLILNEVAYVNYYPNMFVVKSDISNIFSDAAFIDRKRYTTQLKELREILNILNRNDTISYTMNIQHIMERIKYVEYTNYYCGLVAKNITILKPNDLHHFELYYAIKYVFEYLWLCDAALINGFIPHDLHSGNIKPYDYSNYAKRSCADRDDSYIKYTLSDEKSVIFKSNFIRPIIIDIGLFEIVNSYDISFGNIHTIVDDSSYKQASNVAAVRENLIDNYASGFIEKFWPNYKNIIYNELVTMDNNLPFCEQFIECPIFKSTIKIIEKPNIIEQYYLRKAPLAYYDPDSIAQIKDKYKKTDVGKLMEYDDLKLIYRNK